MTGALPREPPYRIAFLEPELALDAADLPLRGTAALLLFVTLFQHMVRHPGVAVIDPDDTGLQLRDGDVVNVAQRREADVHRELFSAERRDELLWLSISFTKSEAPVVLRTLLHDGTKQSFAAMGAHPLSTRVAQCLGQWLAARGLGAAPRALEVFDAASFLDVSRRLRARVDDAFNARDAEPGDALDATEPDLPPTDEDAPADTDGPVEGSRVETSGELGVDAPPVLAIPFLRALSTLTGLETFPFILDLDPDDPWSLRDRFFATLRRGRDFGTLRRVLAVAPAWGKPYLSWRRAPGATRTRAGDDGIEDEDELHAYAAAALRIPGNHWALANYAGALEEAGRIPEAIRWQARALAASGFSSTRYRGLIWLEGRLGRRGRQMRSAPLRVRELEGRLPEDVRRVDPELLRCRLAVSDALMSVGRHGEAVLLREALLRGNETRWPHQVETLEHWRRDPARLAQAYAREGHFRGDPGRVLEGLSAVSPHEAYGFEAAALMRAFVSLGDPGSALLAWAHLEARPEARFAGTRLEAARVLLLAGDLERATRELLGVALRHPQHGYETRIDRLLRLSVTCGADVWDGVISRHLARGARTVARLLARDAADFVPDAETKRGVADALGAREGVAFDPTWLDPLRVRTRREAVARIDTLFKPPLSTLAESDAFVNGWMSALKDGDVGTSDAAGELAYLATQAIARYFAATTTPGSPGLGALRVVGAEALQACALLAAHVDDASVIAILTVLERAAVCDPWTLDTWLLRVERAFTIDARWHGHLDVPTRGLPRLASLLRGDERVAAELRTAHELRRAKTPGWGVLAHPLLARAMRAGAEPSHEWSDAAAEGLSPEEAVDVQWTCLAATASHATPALNAAKLFASIGRPGDALEAACSGLGFAGETWRKEHLAELAPLWEAAKIDVPIDWKRCNAEGAAALQKGNLPRAIRCLRWCAALEPDNRELWRNLGIAYAQKGDAFEAVRAFARFDDATEGVKLAGLVLCQAKHAKAGLAVLEYISRWFTRAEDHRYHALFAWQANDDGAMARAYGRAFDLDPAALNGVDLDGYAGLLWELGDPAGCERVTKRLEAVAASDPELQACAWHNRARADIAFERWDDALTHVQKAIAVNPSAARKPYLEETLALIAKREQGPVTVLASDPEAAVFASLADGDFREVMKHATSPSPRLRHAALLASEFRYETENETPVTARARKTAERVLSESLGATDVHAVLARIEALSVRESALFSLDPPPPLGDRLARERFRHELALRGGLPAPASLPRELPPDRELPSGAPITRTSAYAELLVALKGSDPEGVLRAHGLDFDGFERVCTAWSEGMARDADLAASVAARMGG